jgi:hypothetical protein
MLSANNNSILYMLTAAGDAQVDMHIQYSIMDAHVSLTAWCILKWKEISDHTAAHLVSCKSKGDLQEPLSIQVFMEQQPNTSWTCET